MPESQSRDAGLERDLPQCANLRAHGVGVPGLIPDPPHPAALNSSLSNPTDSCHGCIPLPQNLPACPPQGDWWAINGGSLPGPSPGTLIFRGENTGVNRWVVDVKSCSWCEDPWVAWCLMAGMNSHHWCEVPWLTWCPIVGMKSHHQSEVLLLAWCPMVGMKSCGWWTLEVEQQPKFVLWPSVVSFPFLLPSGQRSSFKVMGGPIFQQTLKNSATVSQETISLAFVSKDLNSIFFLLGRRDTPGWDRGSATAVTVPVSSVSDTLQSGPVFMCSNAVASWWELSLRRRYFQVQETMPVGGAAWVPADPLVDAPWNRVRRDGVSLSSSCGLSITLVLRTLGTQVHPQDLSKWHLCRAWEEKALPCLREEGNCRKAEKNHSPAMPGHR